MVKEFISQLPPDKLSPFAKHPYQVREDGAMDELTESIRVHGILSPLLARPKGEGCELVSGHRRRLAAQKLGLPTVPVLVREMNEELKQKGFLTIPGRVSRRYFEEKFYGLRENQ